jgi:hypothetical protein
MSDFNGFMVLGYYLEKYWGDSVSGHNCDFTYTPTICDKHHLFLEGFDDKIIQVSLWDREGECGSGWTTASFGEMLTQVVDAVPTNIVRPLDLSLCIITNYANKNEGDINTNVFNISEYGGCMYYPSGSVDVSTELFHPLEYNNIVQASSEPN